VSQGATFPRFHDGRGRHFPGLISYPVKRGGMRRRWIAALPRKHSGTDPDAAVARTVATVAPGIEHLPRLLTYAGATFTRRYGMAFSAFR
jgi:hypothetical protein